MALNNHFAIKFLHRASAQRDLTRKRFETEAQVTAQLKTRHAVQVFDFGITDEGQPYLVMELLDGETVGHRLDRLKRLPVATTARFLAQASRALERAHALGIVHRDFKPDNMVIAGDEDGREYIKVLDFGIAKILGELEAEPGEEDPTITGSHQSFTRTGSILGTPYYMAPEQIRNSRDIDARVDIWAFGVVAFECLVGVPPFDGKDVYDLFDKIQAGTHARAVDLNPDVPSSFDMWFDIACAVDPDKRFANAKLAATHLALALGDSGDVDTTRSGDLGDRPSEPHPRRDPAVLAHAATMEQTQAGKVRSRKRRSVGESAASLPLVRVAQDPVDIALKAAFDESTDRGPRVARVEATSRGGTRNWIVIAFAAVAGAIAAVWLQPFTPHRAPPTAVTPPAATPETPVAAVPQAPAVPLPSAEVALPPASISAAVAPSASPTRPAAAAASTASTVFTARKAAATAPPPPSAAPVASAPAAVLPQPRPAPTRSTSSPFELPPLGI